MSISKLSPKQRALLRREYADGQTTDETLMARYGLSQTVFDRFIASQGLAAERAREIKDVASGEVQRRNALLAGDTDIIGANARLQADITAEHRERIGRLKGLHTLHIDAQCAAMRRVGDLEDALKQIALSHDRKISDEELRTIADRLRELVNPKSMSMLIESGERLINLERKIVGIGDTGEADGSLETFLAKVGRT